MNRFRFRRATALVAAALSIAIFLPAAALATCQAVAMAPMPELPVFQPISFAGRRAAATNAVEIAYLGHSSFLIRSAGNRTAVTDYNGYIRSAPPPDIVTMNHAHATHFTDTIEPGIGHVLRGWDTGAGVPQHNIALDDLRVRNVPTNIRDAFAGTEFAGNSIFIFETAGLCIAHLGHLHHQLEPGHIAQIGLVDVLLAPIDDGWTMAQTGMVAVIETLRPSVVIPMHFSGPWLLDSFAALMRARGYTIRELDSPSVRLTRETLPHKTVLVLPAGQF